MLTQENTFIKVGLLVFVWFWVLWVFCFGLVFYDTQHATQDLF